MYVGLWTTAIKLNPSWKTEVSRSAWIKPCHTNEYHPNALFPGNKICHWLLSFHDSNYFTILWRWSKSISIRRFFCPYFSGQEKLRIRTVFTQWWATSSCFFFEKLCWKNCKKWLLVQAFDKWWCVEWFFVSHCYNCSSITIREIQESSSSVITVFVTKVVTYMKHWLARYFNNLFRSSSRVIRTKFSIVHSTNAQINETL